MLADVRVLDLTDGGSALAGQILAQLGAEVILVEPREGVASRQRGPFADPAQRKLKTPLRFAASAVRESGGESDGGRATLLALNRLGEVPYLARTPAGFPEEASHWVDPGAVLERMGFAFALARDEIRGTRLGDDLPAPSLERRLGRDEERALAIAAPEFQWA